MTVAIPLNCWALLYALLVADPSITATGKSMVVDRAVYSELKRECMKVPQGRTNKVLKGEVIPPPEPKPKKW